MAKDAGVADAFDIPGFIATYIGPMSCRGRPQFRFIALSGNPRDIARISARLIETIPKEQALHRWLEMASSRVRSQGLPARTCWLGLPDRARAGLAINAMVEAGEVEAPILVCRDHVREGEKAGGSLSGHHKNALIIKPSSVRG